MMGWVLAPKEIRPLYYVNFQPVFTCEDYENGTVAKYFEWMEARIQGTREEWELKNGFRINPLIKSRNDH